MKRFVCIRMERLTRIIFALSDSVWSTEGSTQQPAEDEIRQSVSPRKRN